jgi:hypothetical protein
MRSDLYLRSWRDSISMGDADKSYAIRRFAGSNCVPASTGCLAGQQIEAYAAACRFADHPVAGEGSCRPTADARGTANSIASDHEIGRRSTMPLSGAEQVLHLPKAGLRANRGHLAGMLQMFQG